MLAKITISKEFVEEAIKQYIYSKNPKITEIKNIEFEIRDVGNFYNACPGVTAVTVEVEM